MANYSVLKAAVQAVVKTNGNQEITGANMQSTLISIINSLGTGYQFMGVATPSTSPGTPDYNVAYIGGAGTYANFGTSVTVPAGSICVFKFNGSWTKEQVALFAGIDDVPTAGSDNLVKSGGVYRINETIAEITGGEVFLTPNYTTSKYITTSGGIGNSSSWKYSEPIFLKKGETITLSTTGTGVAAIAEVVSVDTSYAVIVRTQSDTTEYTYTATADKYVAVNMRTDYADGYVKKTYLRTYALKSEFDNLNEDVNNISTQLGNDETDINKNAQDIISIKGDIEIIKGEDYTIYPTWNTGYYISNNGVVTQSSSWEYSDPIFLPKGRTIKLTTGGSSVAYISETNADGSVHTSYQLAHSDIGYYEKTNNSDKYVCVCGFIGNNDIPVTVHISPDPAALSLTYLNNKINDIYNPDFINIFGDAVNDALNETCASDCQISYDDTLGLVAVTYSAGKGVYGESWDKGVLSIFPISNPNMVEHTIYAEIGQSYTIVRPWDSVEETYNISSTSDLSICMNVIALGGGIFRIIYCVKSAWVYRDYNYNTHTLGTIYFIEVNYDGTSRKCSWDKFTTFLTNIGLSNDNTHKQVYLTSQIMPKDENDRVYITFSGNNSYPILCYMNIDNNNMVLTPFAAYPYYSGYEAAFVKNGNTISLISRNNNDTPKGYSLAKSTDNGATWSIIETLDTGDNNRPRIIGYNNGVLVAYGINDNNKLRHTIKLRVGTDVSSLNELMDIYGRFGLSLFSLLIVRDNLYVAWSDGQANMGQKYGTGTSDKNKDCVKFSIVREI